MGGDQLNVFIEMLEFLIVKKQQVHNVILKFLKDQSSENRIWPNDREVIDYLTMFPMPDNKARKMMISEVIETHIKPEHIEPLGNIKKLTVNYILSQKEWEDNTEKVERNASILLGI